MSKSNKQIAKEIWDINNNWEGHKFEEAVIEEFTRVLDAHFPDNKLKSKAKIELGFGV